MSQGNVAEHEGAEGNTKLACCKAMWLGTKARGCRRQHKACVSQSDVARHGGAEGNTKLASDGGGVPKAAREPNDDEMPKGTEKGENDRSHFC
ncbi:unnamed protein product [Prunus armeniaca]